MANDNDKQSADIAAAAPTGASGATTIRPDALDYPEYFITFGGSCVFDEKMNPKPSLLISGPHTFFLRTVNPDVTLRIEFRHNPTDPPVPNLTAVVTEE